MNLRGRTLLPTPRLKSRLRTSRSGKRFRQTEFVLPKHRRWDHCRHHFLLHRRAQAEDTLSLKQGHHGFQEVTVDVSGDLWSNMSRTTRMHRTQMRSLSSLIAPAHCSATLSPRVTAHAPPISQADAAARNGRGEQSSLEATRIGTVLTSLS